MDENELSQKIIGICINVHREFGPGLFECVYLEAICVELLEKNIPFTKQQGIEVFYKGVNLGLGFRADIIVDNKVLLEIKSIEKIAPVHYKQVITYLKLTDIKLGLLFNFNVNLLKEGIFRLVNKL